MIEVGKPPDYDSRFPNSEEFPKCNVRGHNICCKERAWTPDKGGRWMHPQAKSAGDDIDYGLGYNCARYECPVCGKYFEVELPQ
jgi:hypothetical protein